MDSSSELGVPLWPEGLWALGMGTPPAENPLACGPAPKVKGRFISGNDISSALHGGAGLMVSNYFWSDMIFLSIMWF